ncbi:MAG: glycosyltransferase family 4 protein [Candidatus Eremiobacteraeota bacterium]|nr:glycosyltransferase family 4 protein [Candidatus Eremiobacteraeota bacterium]MBC5827160.1 glycosyltransferase family 4 protein [Candidatus Eremiobacteraeota bacterium]
MSRLRVGIETQFGVGAATGLGVFATGLVDALRRRDEVEAVELRDPSFDLWRFTRRVYWDQVRAPALAKAAACDVLHFTGGTLPLRVPHPVVLSVHDLHWRRRRVRARPYIRWYFGSLQGRLARRADRIAADTHCARAEIIESLNLDPLRVVVTGVGVDAAFFRLERRPSDRPFVLSVGTVEERKDLSTAVRAIARVPDVSLVSVGPLTHYADDVRRLAVELGIQHRVKLCGYVGEETLHDLYASASALVFPSRYEGFGLPPLQALAAGLPVVAARIPVSEEVLGECAFLAPSGDAAEFARSIDSALREGPASQRAAAGRVRAARYSWDRVAEETTALYKVFR